MSFAWELAHLANSFRGISTHASSREAFLGSAWKIPMSSETGVVLIPPTVSQPSVNCGSIDALPTTRPLLRRGRMCSIEGPSFLGYLGCCDHSPNVAFLIFR